MRALKDKSYLTSYVQGREEKERRKGALKTRKSKRLNTDSKFLTY